MNEINGRDPALATAIMVAGFATKWRKTALVWAFRLSEEVTVLTPEGAMVAHDGDYLASDDPPTHLWPVRREVFERTYEPFTAASDDDGTCPVCGHPVRVVGSGEGTRYYEPIEVLDVARLAQALGASEFCGENELPHSDTFMEAAEGIAREYRDGGWK